MIRLKYEINFGHDKFVFFYEMVSSCLKSFVLISLIFWKFSRIETLRKIGTINFKFKF